jgi:hypothetical protein
MPQRLTNEIITAAIDGFEAQKRRLDDQIAELRGLLDGKRTEPAATSEAAPGKRKKFSAASRRKMALAQTARWAKIKGESEAPEAAVPVKKKRRMSAAARKAISEATTKRWAALRAAQEQAAKKVAMKKSKSAKKRTKAVKKSAPAALASAPVS